ncbi:NAD(P)H-hydrate dehydratase [Jeotgalibacillus proteolyticus]|uniref:ADP-dependent (S)-NAD(P)H-hydrate dehydratase n=1 Tax=Jeotgalibacillus proteolyticus TaxID=2082395 RepID=A0A2S5G7H2_9BACL|nr:NAD(P)H-hydrate dehydratase [Jeotgalibacillus proteolyticus]PPA68937.1 NAD(P)H-hydrate dehydratase [Jeotgalibacillus proteolyticus]
MSNGEVSWWSEEDVRSTLPKREATGHKGTYGTGLLLAGSRDMPGAALLAGIGALRSGIGKLVIGTDKEVIGHAVSIIPEATYLSDGLKKIGDSSAGLDSYKAAAAGPGIEPDSTTEAAIKQLLSSDVPLILDAGALSERSYPERQAPVILTPHLGEFSRITGMEIKVVKEDRAGHALSLAEKLGVTIVLKGNESVIAFPDGEVYQNPTGSSALAKGGTGDTLTGMMLGMLCCHKEENWKHAVLNAVHLHGACGEKWTETRSAHTLLAHELSDLLPEVWKGYE